MSMTDYKYLSMLKQVTILLKTCLTFWKGFIHSDNKGLYWAEHKEDGVKPSVKLLGIIAGTAILLPISWHLLKGSFVDMCRYVAQNNAGPMLVQPDRAVPVEAKKLVAGKTLREITSIGSLKANKEVIIKAEITGKIKEIAFTEGSDVNAGDTLVKFEDTALQAEVDRWSAEYALRKEETDRNRTLFQQKAGAQKNFHESEAQMKIALAQLENAKFQLTKATIKAPFSGKIGILKGSSHPGNIVQQQSEMVNLVDNSKMKVEFMVPARFLNDVAIGQAVDITLEAYPNKVFSGAVDAIDSEVDPKNHSILVRAVIPNENNSLKHGMFVNVKLVTGEKDGVIVVDDECLDREGQHEFVWVIDKKGQAYRRKVITGAKNENGVEIVAGLASGEIVVVSGQLRLTDGAKTKILNANDFKGDAILKSPSELARSVINNTKKARR